MYTIFFSILSFFLLSNSFLSFAETPQNLQVSYEMISWSGTNQPGNKVCGDIQAQCKKVYADNGSAFPCGYFHHSGTAQCELQSGSKNTAWLNTASSGDKECHLQNSICTQSYDRYGNTFACSAVINPGSATCSNQKETDNINITWQFYFRQYNNGRYSPTYRYQTGNRSCAQNNTTCIQASDNSGNKISCGTLSNGGSAICSRNQDTLSTSWFTLNPDDYHYSNYHTNYNNYKKSLTYSGNKACEIQNAACTQSYFPNGDVSSCGTPIKAGSAQCSQGVGKISTSWEGKTSSGNESCTDKKTLCTQAYNSQGNSISCSSSIPNGSALCLQTNEENSEYLIEVKDMEEKLTLLQELIQSLFPETSIDPTTTYKPVVEWKNDYQTGSTTGNKQCGNQDSACTKAYNSSEQEISCSLFQWEGFADCSKGATVTTGWETVYFSTGDISCRKKNSICTKAYNSSEQEVSCSTSISTGSAQCRKNL